MGSSDVKMSNRAAVSIWNGGSFRKNKQRRRVFKRKPETIFGQFARLRLQHLAPLRHPNGHPLKQVLLIS